MPTLIEQLQKKGVLHSSAIQRALEEVDRADFVPEEMLHAAYDDVALPIGEGQTISQPYTVVFMLEHLQVRPGDTVLEVGYGSGWQTALLAHLVGPLGKVYAFEIVRGLCKIGKENVDHYPALAQRVDMRCMSAQQGYNKAAPFDRLIAAAEVTAIPQAWRDQLALDGRMIYPKGNALMLDVKQQDGSFESKTFPGFVFVPFIDA